MTPKDFFAALGGSLILISTALFVIAAVFVLGGASLLHWLFTLPAKVLAR